MGNVQARKKWELDNRAAERLDVQGQHLTYAHIATIKFSEFRNLTYLNLNYNDIERLPPKIGKLGAASSGGESVILSGGSSGRHGTLLGRSDKDVGSGNFPTHGHNERSPRRLKRLTLVRNKLTSLPAEMEGLTGLQRLEVGNNMLAAIPANFFEHMPLLEEFSAFMNKITELPREIGWARSLKKLILSVNHISKLPEEVGLCINLVELDLATNLLTSLPEMFGQLTTMQRLNLSCNRMKVLSDLIGNLTQLDRLDLRFNELRRLPPAIANCTSLHSLYLGQNKLKQLPSLHSLTNLYTLAAEENKLTSIDEICMPESSSLIDLLLAGNNLTSLPDAISTLSELVTLSLEDNKLETIPSSIKGLTALQKLFLTNNSLNSLPAEINSLENLCELELGNNNLTSLPTVWGNLSRLALFDMHNNFLSALPDSIGNLPRLRIFGASINLLSTLPESFSQLTGLTKLNLSGNGFEDVPACLLNMGKLQKLFFAYTNITTWPASKDITFTTLTVLYLAGNELRDIPEGITGLTLLKELHLSNNSIKKIPASIVNLASSLHILDVSANKLTELPVELGSCVLLTELELSHNKLTTAHGLKGLVSLIELDMSGNSFSVFPSAAIEELVLLEQFKIGHCKIQHLTKEDIRILEGLMQGALSWLSIEGNPCTVDVSPALRIISEKTVPLKGPLTGAGWGATVSWSEMRGLRPTMEDTIYVGKNFRGRRGDFLLGLFDGHRGPQAAYLAGAQLPQVLIAALAKHNDDPGLALQATFFRLEELIVDSKTEAGCTAVIALFLQDTLWIGSAGDSRAVLSVKGKAHRVTTDHTGRVPAERKRIQDLGGYVSEKGRVMGDLAVSRSLGDVPCLPYVTCTPDIHKISVAVPKKHKQPKSVSDSAASVSIQAASNTTATSSTHNTTTHITSQKKTKLKRASESSASDLTDIDGEDSSNSSSSSSNSLSNEHVSTGFDDFLILACDGVWDVLKDQEAVNIVARAPHPRQAAVRIRDHAYFSQSSDNISAIVLHGFQVHL
eukprot:TRINITY_DN2842_c1_g1_i2.p1 TRINITY_DN2842_c1_g1~~TRINITY_DN2842_c1_g1_i2.p1  ORF type:complete len:1021 (-),score=130.51 TRINITY_DN2842_c1_g1_i2:58-3120(-)